MAFRTTAFKTIARAAVLASVLGASSLAAAPAFAQGGSAAFSIEFEGNQSGQYTVDSQRRDRRGGRDDRNDDRYHMRCLTNREVAAGISAYGYRSVKIVQERRRDQVDVEAVKGNWLYSMRVDKCSGQVDRMERIGRSHGGGQHRGRNNDRGWDNNNSTGSGFRFQFNLGN